MTRAADQVRRRCRTRRLIVIAGLLCGATAVGDDPAGQPPSEVTSSCITPACHVALASSPFTHAPVARQKCLACHLSEEPRDHRFTLPEEPSALCTTCHVSRHRTFVHDPVRRGDCLGCHDPHGSTRRLMLRDDPASDLCTGCHADVARTDLAFVHGPVATGACILCHEAHSAWHPGLLHEPAPTLCVRCHEEVRDVVAAPHVHAPVETGCVSCHDPHASDTPYQLRQETPELCLSCHAEVQAELDVASIVHGAMDEPGGCRQCHAGHVSALPALLRHGETTLCLQCHDQAMTATDGRTIADMAALLRDNPFHHGPVREGACSACHRPHAGEHAQLLRAEYPPEFYAAFDPERYTLCFECHIPEMVTSEEGRGVTRFRDGELNLHWLHVNRDKGRTCRACHEVHASRNPFHVRDAVPFGASGWELAIRFEVSDDGGSCLPDCHARQTYARGPGPDSIPDSSQGRGGS